MLLRNAIPDIDDPECSQHEGYRPITSEPLESEAHTFPPRELRLLRAMQDAKVACIVGINQCRSITSDLSPSEGKRREEAEI